MYFPRERKPSCIASHETFGRIMVTHLTLKTSKMKRKKYCFVPLYRHMHSLTDIPSKILACIHMKFVEVAPSVRIVRKYKTDNLGGFFLASREKRSDL